jgi:hypothetical protein
MGNWYKVTKRINGRLYDYWQRTNRVGGRVKTENKYIGPAGSVKAAAVRAAMAAPGVNDPNDIRHIIHGANTIAYDHAEKVAYRVVPADQYQQTVTEHREHLANADYTPPAPEVIEPEPKPRREDYTADEWRELQRLKREQKREFDAAMKIQNAKVRAVKRKTRGIKAVNPFLAQGMELKPLSAPPHPRGTTPNTTLPNLMPNDTYNNRITNGSSDTMDKRTLEWVKQQLINDEYSSNEEMHAYFIDGGLTATEADEWIRQRDYYRNNIVMYDEIGNEIGRYDPHTGTIRPRDED